MSACRKLALLAAGITTATWCAAAWQSPPAQAPVQKKSPPKSRQKPGVSLTGCVDQQDEKFVLLDDRTRNPVADLEADGFPSESFAKHLGQKVTIRGTSSPGDPRPVFKVRSVETVNDVCAPAVEPQ